MRDCRQNTSNPRPSTSPPSLDPGNDHPFREVALLAVPGWLGECLRQVGRGLHTAALEAYGLASGSERPVNVDHLEAVGRDLLQVGEVLGEIGRTQEESSPVGADLAAAELAAGLAPRVRALAGEIDRALAGLEIGPEPPSVAGPGTHDPKGGRHA